MKDGFYGIQSALAENRFAQQNCCCEIKGGIKDLSAEGYRNTCEITTAIHAEGEATRALINSNTMQELRDKLADRDRELQTANFQLSQQTQNATLIGTLRPFPQPAYITCSPYQSTNGTLVPGATASVSSASTTDVRSLAFSKLIQVKPSCCAVNNTTNLTFNNAGLATTFTNVNVVITKVA